MGYCHPIRDHGRYVPMKSFEGPSHYIPQHALFYALHFGVDGDDGARGARVLPLFHDRHSWMHHLQICPVPNDLAGGEEHVSFSAHRADPMPVETKPPEGHFSRAIIDPGVAEPLPARTGIRLAGIDNPSCDHILFPLDDICHPPDESSVLVSYGYEIKKVFYYPYAPPLEGTGNLWAYALHRRDGTEQSLRKRFVHGRCGSSSAAMPGAAGEAFSFCSHVKCYSILRAPHEMVYNKYCHPGYMEIIREALFKTTRVRVIRGDLTEATVDAIVNAANSRLQHGGGVAGAIVRKGGAIIQAESDRIGHVPVGESALTTAGALKAKYVIHTVGPRWGEGDEEVKLRSAVRNTLKLAQEKAFAAIAMPAISAGIFGFPKDQCARIMVEEIAAFTDGHKGIEAIDIYLMDDQIIDFFSREVERMEKAS